MSSAWFDSSDIALMCQKKIDHIKESREKEWEDAKAREMACVNSGFFHKLFKCNDIDLAEAERRLRTDRWSYVSYTNRYWRQMDLAERILELANRSTEILITDEEMEQIRE
jgi:hypothetical protein